MRKLPLSILAHLLEDGKEKEVRRRQEGGREEERGGERKRERESEFVIQNCPEG